ncbi:hypothetical protein K438DRAFT_2025520 [Mycena galopus ATCC 62051]|nr:hypothetical protein K438DRAFT_2025520 [Mycena galopus ATCC 62051]
MSPPYSLMLRPNIRPPNNGRRIPVVQQSLYLGSTLNAGHPSSASLQFQSPTRPPCASLPPRRFKTTIHVLLRVRGLPTRAATPLYPILFFGVSHSATHEGVPTAIHACSLIPPCSQVMASHLRHVSASAHARTISAPLSTHPRRPQHAPRQSCIAPPSIPCRTSLAPPTPSTPTALERSKRHAPRLAAPLAARKHDLQRARTGATPRKPPHGRYSVRDIVRRPHARHRPVAHPSPSPHHQPRAQHTTPPSLAAQAAFIASPRTATFSAVYRPRRSKYAPPVLHDYPLRAQAMEQQFLIARTALIASPHVATARSQLPCGTLSIPWGTTGVRSKCGGRSLAPTPPSSLPRAPRLPSAPTPPSARILDLSRTVHATWQIAPPCS